MASKTVMNDALYAYLLSISPPQPEILRRLREETQRLPMSGMQISPEQGPLLSLLVRLTGARKALEVGVFTGYSGLVTAMALPEDGRLVACDVSEEWTRTARRYWQEAGVAHKIDLRIAPAVETLDSLLAGGEAGTFDFAFIDADKPGYDSYYERALQLVRVGGLIVLDNTFMGGRSADANDSGEGVVAMRALNAKLAGDTRIALCALPVADGLALALKL